MRTYNLYWAPEGRKIATVQANTGWDARKMAPEPYRKYLGEIYSVVVTCGHCGEVWPCSDLERTDISGIERAKHHIAEDK
jgi:hypothetical protein